MEDMRNELNLARQRVLKGEKLTLEEQQRLLAAIRQSRTAAAEAGATARTKRNTKASAKSGVSDAQLDADLAALGL